MGRAAQRRAASRERDAAAAALMRRYSAVREATFRLCTPLETEDYIAAAAVDDCRPAAWHLAHTTLFFETAVLGRHDPEHRPHREGMAALLGSEAAHRGVLTRPTVGEVFEYRRRTDQRIAALIESASVGLLRELAGAIEAGLDHERRHQERMLADLKRLLWCNPLRPAYRAGEIEPCRETPMGWVALPEGVRGIGEDGREGPARAEETPRHRVFLEAFEIADRTVTCGEFLRFVEDGGYQRRELWQEEGWAVAQREGWEMPLYWRRDGAGRVLEYTLMGERALDPHAPVCHVSFYEAEAYARWAGARLPTEAEWEVAALAAAPSEGNVLETGRLHPADAAGAPGPVRRTLGDVWEWTASEFGPYPGRRAPGQGGIGGGRVVRGGSCVTPGAAVRATARRRVRPGTRSWFTGIRLARWSARR